jgi:hypothetical protein
VKLAEIIFSINGQVAFIEQIIYSQRLQDKTLRRFLKRAISIIKGKGISIIRFMGFKSNVYNRKEMNQLKRLGFIFTGKGIPFIFKHLSAKDNDMDIKNLFISRLYTQGNL